MFEEEYIMSLLDKCDAEDNKIKYITRKISKYGIDAISLNEYNYVREINKLPELEIRKLRGCLYESMVGYSELQESTKISRAMLCMILRGTRNCTLNQLKKILKYLSNLNIKFEW